MGQIENARESRRKVIKLKSCDMASESSRLAHLGVLLLAAIIMLGLTSSYLLAADAVAVSHQTNEVNPVDYNNLGRS